LQDFNLPRGVDLKLRQTPISKITRPRLPKIYARTRLFRLLDRQRRVPVTWITGPPGSGKTTLVASYLDSRRLPALWYQVDEGDADLSTFFYYMGQAAKKAAPRNKQPLPLLTPEYQFGIPTFTRRFFEDLSGRLKRPFALVLDNYQDAPEGSAFHETLVNGLSALPEGVTAILISRADPPPVFARMEANKIMSVIGWEHLQLTPEETSGMMRLRTGKAISRESLQKLCRKTSGWAAGVVLIEASQTRGGSQIDAEAMVPGKVSDYFGGEIFDKVDKGMQGFLLKTAYLPRMTPRMAEAITNNNRAGRILMDLNRRNSFTERRAGPEISYQYHAMFREFLLNRTEREYPEAARSKLQRAAAKLLEESGQIEDAADLLRRAEAWDELAGLILKSAPEMNSQGRLQTLKGWIESLSKDITARQPWLLYWLGVCALAASPAQSGITFKRAFELFKTRKDGAGLFLSLAGLFDSVTFDFDNFSEYDRLIPVLYQLRAKGIEYPSQEIEARVVDCMLYALYVRQPRHPDLEYWMSRGSALAKSIVDIDGKARILLMLALIRLYAGDLEKTAVILDSLRTEVMSRRVTPTAMVILRDLEVNYTWLAAEFDKSREAANAGIAFADATGAHALDVFILGNGAAAALSTGEMERADWLLERMRSCLDGRAMSWGENLYHNLSAWKCLLQRRLAEASLHADNAIASGVRSGAVTTEAYHHLIKAIVLHELKKESEASVCIAKVRRIVRSVTMNQTKFRALLLEAQFAFDRGDEASGMAPLRQAMALGRERGYYNAIFWVPSAVTKLCIKSLEDGIEVDYVRELIRKRNLVPEEPPYLIEHWPWPLRIFTLGRFEIRKDDKPLVVSKKGQKKPLQLLKVLIALGGEDVREERLADLLWPDAEGDAGLKAVNVNTVRLRKLLGSADAILVREGTLTLNPRTCWVDAWVFDRMLDNSEFGVQSSAPTSGKMKSAANIAMLEKAFAFYKGPFLAGEPGSWTAPLREKLRYRFLRCIDVVGGHMEQSRQYKGALSLYQRGLEVDDLAESYYQRMMTCYLRLGRHAEALSVYRRCEKTFVSYGIEPSRTTEFLHKKIFKGKVIKR